MLGDAGRDGRDGLPGTKGDRGEPGKCFIKLSPIKTSFINKHSNNRSTW